MKTDLENPGKSPIMNWLRDHLDYPHKDYCLIWPFGKNEGGYGTFGRNGKKFYAHRFICEIKSGPAPTDDHQAAHSCNRGHEGCVNHHHIRWKTRSENLLEAAPHKKVRLFPEQVEEIRRMKGLENTRITAERFDVREATIRDIQAGRTWKVGCRSKKMFYDAEVQHIRSMAGVKSAKELATQYGVGLTTIYHIWYRTSWKHVPEVNPILPSGMDT